MDMNYLKQIKGFYLRRKLYPISSKAITLYYLLLEQFNMVGFPRDMTIPLGRLTSESGLGKTAICKARRELVDSGYLTLSTQKKWRDSAVYSINAIEPSEYSDKKGKSSNKAEDSHHAN